PTQASPTPPTDSSFGDVNVEDYDALDDEDNEKRLAARAVAMVIDSSRRGGVVTLCADVASLLRRQRGLELRLRRLTAENAELRVAAASAAVSRSRSSYSTSPSPSACSTAATAATTHSLTSLLTQATQTSDEAADVVDGSELRHAMRLNSALAVRLARATRQLAAAEAASAATESGQKLYQKPMMRRRRQSPMRCSADRLLNSNSKFDDSRKQQQQPPPLIILPDCPCLDCSSASVSVHAAAATVTTSVGRIRVGDVIVLRDGRSGRVRGFEHGDASSIALRLAPESRVALSLSAATSAEAAVDTTSESFLVDLVDISSVRHQTGENQAVSAADAKPSVEYFVTDYL
ncbi:hypothetical protein BOX15_Mlig015549g1, partial [Macrostomum lignano]